MPLKNILNERKEKKQTTNKNRLEGNIYNMGKKKIVVNQRKKKTESWKNDTKLTDKH